MHHRSNLFSSSLAIVSVVLLAACGSTVIEGGGDTSNAEGGNADPSGSSSTSGGSNNSGGGGGGVAGSGGGSNTGGSSGGTGGRGGVFDFGPPHCDSNLALDDADPYSAAKAIELCKSANGPGEWGLIEAKWTLSDGSPIPAGFATQYAQGHGLYDGFGSNVFTRKGDRMLALSTGAARRPGDPDYQAPSPGFGKGYPHAEPAGFPKPSPACAGLVTSGAAHDGVALEVTLRAPQPATGFKFDFNYYTVEYPEFTCTSFNDVFAALLTPTPAGQTDGNISFDNMGNIISVNNVFLEVCDAVGPGGPGSPCSLGSMELLGTGYDNQQGGATGWLTTTAPVQGNDVITVRFTVYDSGDIIFDSATLVDNFRWLTVPNSAVGTVRAVIE